MSTVGRMTIGELVASNGTRCGGSVQGRKCNSTEKIDPTKSRWDGHEHIRK